MGKDINDTTKDALLDPLRAIIKQQAIQLRTSVNQVGALPDDPQLEYYFIPSQYMDQYKAYHRPGKPFRNIKLVNYGHPAVSLAFYRKHKYRIDRDVDPNEAIRYISEYRDELMQLSLTEQLTLAQLQSLQQNNELLSRLRLNSAGFEFCFSNYYHYYHYWYCTFRYFTDATLTKLDSDNEHLLKHTERVKNKVHERLNIIFIDTEYISRPVPLDNKLVDRELALYPNKIKHGTTTLYIREMTGDSPTETS